jgi:cyclic pyranopterin phosphate synthase
LSYSTLPIDRSGRSGKVKISEVDCREKEGSRVTEKKQGALTHVDDQGRLKMVDVTDKDVTDREAVAEATVHLRKETLEHIENRELPKGNVYEAARIAGILAAKKTWELIPLCHPLQVTGVEVDFFPNLQTHTIRIVARIRTTDRTGVEMEALTAVSVAALTIYDMCKAVDREVSIGGIQLNSKSGGKSGSFVRKP